MNIDKADIKLIAAVAMGAIAGILLSRFWLNTEKGGKPLSTHIATLSKVLKQIESMDTEDTRELKKRIQNILKIVESSYGTTKEKRQ